jgi:arylsulfatase A-like enzyme
MGLLENTVIIIVADHGEEFLDHGRWGHWENNLYDEILKVPFIISLPEGKHPAAIKRQVRVMDLMPTVLELAGCPADPKMEGTSLAPLWTGEGQYPVDNVISEMLRDDWHRVAVRTGNYKLIWDSRNQNKPVLFDLIQDPAERHDIAKKQSVITAQMQACVEAHLQRVKGTSPSATIIEPELDESVLQRLRGLGYIE